LRASTSTIERSAAALGCLDHVRQLILEDRLGIVQQPPDQRRLAVVDGAGGGEPQKLCGAGGAGGEAGAGGQRGHQK
jgi:hypothetical protein